jgi:hypothetical protein
MEAACPLDSIGSAYVPAAQRLPEIRRNASKVLLTGSSASNTH